MSWIEASGRARHALRFATFDGSGFSQPADVVISPDLFVNWADFPSLVAASDGSLVAHWLRKTARDPYAYHVEVARSPREGAAFAKAIVAHGDLSATEHGFVSLEPLDGGNVGILWLDGRKMAGLKEGDGAAEMTLRYAVVDPSGAVRDERLLDERTCDCCQTALARTKRGLVAAYRDRSAEEVRDIATVVERGGTWSAPRLAAKDGWRIDGCPVNGPQLAADGDRVALAWFSMAEDRPSVSVAFSEDAGESWGPRVGVDDGHPLGRVDVAMIGGRALVSWSEMEGSAASVRVRLVDAAGTRGSSTAVAQASAARAAGFPRLASTGSDAFIAWTDAGEPSHVRLARLRADAR